MRTALIATAALGAAVVVSCLMALPPPPLVSTGSPDPSLRARTLAGAVHVHSTVSDGAGSRAEIAAAAARAGLQFVVFTDHGDGTRPPEPAAYVGGVLCVDAVEISTDQGHYLALELGASPYRLGGSAAAVVEDVARLGGFGVVAHPDSPKEALAWRDWGIRVGGVEWLNADTEFRRASRRRIAATLLGYPLRPGPAMAGMLTRPDVTLRRWDAETSIRPVPALAGHDAHGGVGGGLEGGPAMPGLASYESAFRSFATHAILAAVPSGAPGPDSKALLAALRAGRSYTAVQSIVDPAWLDFTAERGSARAVMGEVLDGRGPARLQVRVPQVPGATLVILRDGNPVMTDTATTVDAVVTEAGAYRVEARLAGSPHRVPWLLSNPIYIDIPVQSPPTVVAAPAAMVTSLLNADWRIEHDPTSAGGLSSPGGRERVMTYRLGRGGAGSQFAALVAPFDPPAAPFDAISVDLAAGAPARVSVQVRSGDGRSRWGTSVYVSPDGGARSIPVSALQPAERGVGPFDAGAARSILLVIDLVNAVPGSAGQLVVRDLALTRRF